MSLGAQQLLLNLASWGQGTTDPHVTGEAAAIGSLQMQSGTYPAVPDALHLKVAAGDTDWVHQNVVNLNVFNVKDPAYGAVGDGVVDDTAAIQAAVDACVAAGGGIVYFPPVNVAGGAFYRITRAGANTYCISVIGKDNVSFRGDGFASKVEVVCTDGLALNAFTVASQNIRFRNFHLSGEGISPAAPGGGAELPANYLIYIADVLGVAIANVSIEEMHWGAVPGARVLLQTLLTEVSGVRYRYNLSTATCMHAFTVGLGSATPSRQAVDRLACEFNWFSSAVTPDGLAGYAFGMWITDHGSEFSFTGNMVNQTNGAVIAAQVPRGTLEYNILSNNGSISAADVNARRPVIRGNILDTSSAASTLLVGLGCPCGILYGRTDGTRYDGLIEANLVLLTGSQANSVGIAPNASLFSGTIIADNLANISNPGATVGAITVGSNTNLTGNSEATVIGNVVLLTGNAANVGIAIELFISNIPLTGLAVIGNLCLGVTNAMLVGCRYRLGSATSVGSGVIISFNLINSASTGILYQRTAAQTFSGNRGTSGNNLANIGTAGITLPPDNTGVSGEGSASNFGGRIGIEGALPETRYTAPVGSLCANTAGVAAQALFYKETGTGNTGWLGIGESDITMGTKASSTATANRFMATGSLGLAVESATEFQWAVPRPCQLRHMRLRCTAGTGVVTNTFTLRKNGVDTALTLNIGNTATNATDLVNSVVFAAADKVSLRVSKSGAPTTAQTNIVIAIGVA